MERDVERALTDGLTQVGDGAGPPVASMLARVWLGEVPPHLSLLGGAVVLAGVILVTTRGSARKTDSRETCPSAAVWTP